MGQLGSEAVRTPTPPARAGGCLLLVWLPATLTTAGGMGGLVAYGFTSLSAAFFEDCDVRQAQTAGVSPVQYVADVPIYRCSPEQHSREMNERRELDIDVSMQSAVLLMSGEDLASHYKKVKQRAHQRDPSDWYRHEFNDVVAWIRLFIAGTVFGGEIHLRPGRWRAPMRTMFERDDTQDITVYWKKESTNETVRKELFENIVSLLRVKPFQGRWIDQEQLRFQLAFFDWIGALNAIAEANDARVRRP